MSETAPRMTSEQLRKLCLEHDHLAVPIRPGVRVTWTDSETGEVLQSAVFRAKVIPIRSVGKADA